MGKRTELSDHLQWNSFLLYIKILLCVFTFLYIINPYSPSEKTSEINMWWKVTKSETHHQSERRQLRKKAMAIRVLKTYKYCQKNKTFLYFFHKALLMFHYLYHVQLFFNKCCCNAVLQLGLLLKLCSAQQTDIFLKYSSGKLPETRSVFRQSHSRKETHTHFIHSSRYAHIPRSLPPRFLLRYYYQRSFLCPENQASLKH